MSAKTFNGDQKVKLTQIINEGMQVMHEIDTLQGGLKSNLLFSRKPSSWPTKQNLARKNKITRPWKQFLKPWVKRYKYLLSRRVAHVTSMYHG